MKTSTARRFVRFRWSALALIGIVSLIAVKSTSSAAEPKTESGPLVGAAAPTPTDSAAQVIIDNFVFSPVPLTVKVGTQVTWINHDDIPHTVDSTQGKFKSAALDTDDKFEFRFTEAGEYPFYCRLHPKMTGKIIVQP